MSITQDQIARLHTLTAFKNQDIDISAVIDNFDVLSKVDTSGIDHFTRSGNPHLNLRDDVVEDASGVREELLACSPQRVAAHQIILKGIMHGE